MKTLALVILLLTSTSVLFAQQNMNDSMYEATSNADTIAMKNFITRGVDVNLLIKQGFVEANLIITAVYTKNPEVVKLLLRNGADVDLDDGFGATALMYAVSNSNVEIVKILLEHGADPALKDKSGNNAFSNAKIARNKEITRMLNEMRKDK
ncbi:Ankyrin repeat-containing protein [Chitinophaga sp. CF118]|uniref:ankyrin repeat domain-containing protein n=1 Tax=Chitinophaga sp. CF118 TaxID=1884367 RepID=UPI0008E5968E|nr:ankyrin repeat domain-containing protein [Chitinophaga sp. CF118]SFE90816.1 Ankyrin repeat-containing protein [Chitinophaga sp. CF118]